ncbi:MaoC family dehydratase [Sphingobium sp. CFD-2]|uniref:MaoC family dehydratase n=1 Tax=Sphingobium sp. CFD-2 TaxID=2878542 RepID=UPI00214B02FE|nr:MaoC family dehydratase [Sphingobium sp. CFD-2]
MTAETCGIDTDKVIDDYVAHWNGRIGETKAVPLLRKSHRDYAISSRHVTDDMIRQFAISNGDTNPLWRDPAYAETSPWGRIIAPPMQVVSVSSATSLPQPPDVPEWYLMQAGAIYEMERPLVHGDELDAEDVWLGITEHSKADRPHRTFLLHGERRFRDQDGKHVGRVKLNVFATTPRKGIGAPAPQEAPARERHRYSETELAEIYAHYDDEIAGKLRRGAEPRYWEDVKAGDPIGKVIKGPLDVLDAASFLVSAGAGLGYADKWMLIKDEIGVNGGVKVGHWAAQNQAG